MLRAIVISIFTICLTACVPSEAEFDKRRALLAKDAQFRQKVFDDCVKSKPSEQEMKDTAHLVKAAPEDAQRIFCERATAGIISGSVKYADVQAFYRFQRVTPAMISAIRGSPRQR